MKIKNFQKIKSLEKYISEDIKTIKNSRKDNIVILVNFPLGDSFKEVIEPEDKNSFGYFCKYTIEKGIKLVASLKEKNKNAKIAFIIDDHALMDINDWYLSYYNGFEVTDNIRKNVDLYFKDFKLPTFVQQMMLKYKLTEKDILHSNFFKTPYFQESKFREMYEKKNPNKKIGCADEVILVFEDLSKSEVDHLYFFIPHRCKTVTCSAVSRYNKHRKEKGLIKFKKTHIYLSSNRENKKGEIIDNIEKLEKDTLDVLGDILLIRF